MKKLFYLIPVILLGLSASSFSLYIDKVDYAIVKDPDVEVKQTADTYTMLSPSHWKMINYETSGPIRPVEVTDNGDYIPPKAFHETAKFYGFPVAAFFAKSDDSRTLLSSYTVHATAYSWLWAAFDGLLVLVSLAAAYILNRKKYVSGSSDVAPVPAAVPPPSEPPNADMPSVVPAETATPSVAPLTPEQPVAPMPATSPAPTPAPAKPAPPEVSAAIAPTVAAPAESTVEQPVAQPLPPTPSNVIPATPVPPTIEDIPDAPAAQPGQVFQPPEGSKPPGPQPLQ